MSHGARSQSCAVQGVSLAAPKAPPLQQIPLHICIQAFSICCHIISLLHSAVSPFSPSNSLFLSSCGIWQRVMPRISVEKKGSETAALVPEKFHEEEEYIFFMVFIRKEDCHLSLGNILPVLEIQP